MRDRAAYLPGLAVLAAGVVLHFADLPVVRTVAHQGVDALRRMSAKPLTTDRVCIADIDEGSLSELGQWPWPRHRLAQLVDRLHASGASVVAFDIVFAEPDRTSPSHILRDWNAFYGIPLSPPALQGAESDFDRIFAASLARMPSVLAAFMELTDTPETPDRIPEDPFYRGRYLEQGMPARTWLPQTTMPLTPLPALYERAHSVGFINNTRDHDNIIRRTPLLFAHGPQRLYPALSLEALRLHLGVEQFRIVYGGHGVQSIALRDRSIPTDANGRVTLNYRSTRVPRYPVSEILAGRVTSNQLAQRIVLVGTSAAGLRDLVATPMESEFPGVEVHATVIDNILANDVLIEPGWVFFLMLAITIVGGLALIRVVSRSRAVTSLLCTLALAFGLLLASAYLLQRHNLVLAPVEPIVTWLSIYSVVTVIQYRREERERQKIRGMFGTMVSGDVLRYMEDHPDSLSLAGRRAECTIFFSDLAGFTSISEAMTPDQLSRLLNAYMTPMTRIIMDRAGYVDKFNGDAIMAVWGVPYPQDDHAERACRAALAQVEALSGLNAQLKQRFGLSLSLRIGINSGEVTAGNMGSEDRFQYTVLGDAVNLASRLEGLNKAYGTSILIAEGTKQRLPPSLVTRRIDRVTVAGKTQAVDVYEVRPEPQTPEFVRRYEEALALYASREWEKARIGFLAVLDLQPGDRPAEVMLKRIAEERGTEPGSSP